MSDSVIDLIIYLVLTLGAGAVGMIKSAREKKAKNTPPSPPIFQELLDEDPEESIIIAEKQEIVNSEDVFQQPVSQNEAFLEKMKKEQEESINHFGSSDEERFAVLEKRKQDRKSSVRGKQLDSLFKEEEETTEQDYPGTGSDFEFDIRQAIIASEILNRKY